MQKPTILCMNKSNQALTTNAVVHIFQVRSFDRKIAVIVNTVMSSRYEQLWIYFFISFLCGECLSWSRNVTQSCSDTVGKQVVLANNVFSYFPSTCDTQKWIKLKTEFRNNWAIVLLNNLRPDTFSIISAIFVPWFRFFVRVAAFTQFDCTEASGYEMIERGAQRCCFLHAMKPWQTCEHIL